MADLDSMLTAIAGTNAAYLGETLNTLPSPQQENLARICRVALRRLGDKIAEPGSVHPHVLHTLLTDGANVTDEVATEYWGGLLSCARSMNPRDDRAARRMKTLSRLGEYDIRSHYLFFTTLRLLLRHHRKGAQIAFEDEKTRFRLATFIPAGYYILAMDYNKDEITHMPRIVSDMLISLGMEYLVDGSNSGSDEYLKQHFTSNAIRGEGIVFTPGVQGVQLMLWSFGHRDMPHMFFLDDNFDPRIPGVVMGVDEAGLIYQN